MNIDSALIGYTGFVGSNLAEQHHFDKLYNSKNIAEIESQEIDLLVCAGVSAVKWLANQEPEVDIANIEKLKTHILRAKIKHFVLISTIDIYDTPLDVDEDTIPNASKQDNYGRHRYQLEQWLKLHRAKNTYTIVRLPSLFGNYLKKNLIFDILNPLAKSINKELWQNLSQKLDDGSIKQIKSFYTQDEFGNLQLQTNLSTQVQNDLVKIFANIGFSTLTFTDSRSSFQFYNLTNLWRDISIAIKNNYPVLNLSSEPITAQELVKYLMGNDFSNYTNKGGVSYNMHSKYANNSKYLYHKKEILEQIKIFVADQQ